MTRRLPSPCAIRVMAESVVSGELHSEYKYERLDCDLTVMLTS